MPLALACTTRASQTPRKPPGANGHSPTMRTATLKLPPLGDPGEPPTSTTPVKRKRLNSAFLSDAATTGPAGGLKASAHHRSDIRLERRPVSRHKVPLAQPRHLSIWPTRPTHDASAFEVDSGGPLST